MKQITYTLVALLLLVTTGAAQPSSTPDTPNASATPQPKGATKAIAVSVSGSGQPVLFLPGFSCPGAVWEATIAHLQGSHQSHAVSYAGFVGVPAVAPKNWYAALKQALLDYISANRLNNLTIVGHSMGGNLAVDVAAELPETVTGLILVDAIPCMREVMMPGVPASNIQYESPYNDNMLQMTDEAFEQTATMMAQNMTLSAEKVPTLVNWMQQADRQTYVYGYTDLLRLDLRTVLDRVQARTLILGADFPNEAMARATYDKQYAALANKTLVMAKNSRHFIMFDQPEWFYGQVNAFMNP